jgi:hypothetical protein
MKGEVRHHHSANGYSLRVKSIGKKESGPGAGLCDSCRWMREVKSDRGSVFYLCGRSATDTNFPKYPRLPVLQCRGYEQIEMQSK